jgi:hypothetical protein
MPTFKQCAGGCGTMIPSIRKRCESCRKAHSIAWNRARYRADPERSKRASQSWRDRNLDKVRKQRRDWRAKNLGRELEYRQKWIRENRARFNAYASKWQREWRSRFPDVSRARSRAEYQQKIERLRASGQLEAWREAHRERVRAWQGKNRGGVARRRKQITNVRREPSIALQWPFQK